jgi:phosphoglycerate-specific signal transduction histidine kinase
VLRAAGDHRKLRVAWRLAAVTAMVLMIIVGTYAASLRQRQQRLQSLRAERQRIETDLRRVKAMADQSQPVVVLESGDTRLIVNHEDPNPQPQLLYY